MCTIYFILLIIFIISIIIIITLSKSSIIPIIPILPFNVSPNNYNLSLNKFSFIGAHDAITGSISNIFIPMIKTQTLPIDKLYEKGVRYFDLRVDLAKNFKLLVSSNPNELYFHHVIPLGSINSISYFKNLIKTAIKNKDLIILKFSHFTLVDENEVKNQIQNYIKNNNFDMYSKILNTYDDLNNTIQSLINATKYIIILINGSIQFEKSNYDETISCFINNKTYIEYNISSLEEHNNLLWDNLINYLNKYFDDYKNISHNQMHIIQAFFQAPIKLLDIINLLTYTALNYNGVTNLSNKLCINSKIANYIIKNNKKCNIILLDAIEDNEVVPTLKKFIESNTYKLLK